MRPRSPSKPKPAWCAEPGAELGARHSRQRGLSLIELVVAIMVIGIAVAGVLVVFNQAVRGSDDPVVRKQATAIAESLLTEVLAQPFTFCDPQDAAVTSAASAAGCSVSQDTLGPQPASESRTSLTDPFDNVGDYHGFSMVNGIRSLDDPSTPIAGLDAYSAGVAISQAGATFGLAPAEALKVVVTVTGKGQTVVLTGYRVRYAPNAAG
ncbi:MAG TPA: prepilin-type N-terminal cleavage/methylation domain-containing protein [Rhizobacter sp.]|nr:prepilin-type N-terminal cleavage/methylation domain-containing protein [Rhizobacter sp.]